MWLRLQLLDSPYSLSSSSLSDHQKLRADLFNVVEALQRLDAQLSENELAQNEPKLFFPLPI
jgi:hypothetical protein